MDKTKKIYKKIILWGEDAVNEYQHSDLVEYDFINLKNKFENRISCVEFKTQKELNAYLKGIEDMCGWREYQIVEI